MLRGARRSCQRRRTGPAPGRTRSGLEQPVGCVSRPIWAPGSRPEHRALGGSTGRGPRGPRDARDAQDGGDPDLRVHQELARRSAATGPLQARVDGAPPRRRSRRRPGDLGADPDLTKSRQAVPPRLSGRGDVGANGVREELRQTHAPGHELVLPTVRCGCVCPRTVARARVWLSAREYGHREPAIQALPPYLGRDRLVSMTRKVPTSAVPTAQPPRSRWRLQDAKARFSELVRMAHSDGPQHVTLHGRDAVVVVDADEFKRLRGARTGESLIEALQASPHRQIEIEARRSSMPVRAVKL
jgi:prevent-host-death family protein